MISMRGVVASMRGCKFFIVKLPLVVCVALNLGCSYENVSADDSINIEFEEESSVELFKAVQEFSNKNNLVIQDESKNFPGGLRSTLYEIKNEDGIRLFKVSDLMDKKRFSISVYGVSEKRVRVMFDSMFIFLKESFPGAIVQVESRNK